MPRETLDRFARMDSPVHRLPAGVKFGVAFGFVVLTLLVPRHAWWVYAVESLLLVAVAVVSRIPPWFLLRRILWLEPVLMGVALLALWQPGGPGLFAALVARSTLCLAGMMLAAATTPFSDTLRLLERLHVPRMLMTTLALTFRYQYLLLDESDRMRRARRSRTFHARRGVEWRMLSTVVAHLFLRSIDRAARIHAAMCARGWRP